MVGTGSPSLVASDGTDKKSNAGSGGGILPASEPRDYMSGHIVNSEIWACKEFQQLSTTAKLLWFALRTNPFRKRIPGLQVMFPGMMAELLGVQIEEAKVAITDLCAGGFLEIEELVARMPDAPKDESTTCRNPSVLLRWWSDYREIPNSDTKFAHIESLAESLPLYRATDSFKAVWWGTFGSTFANWYRITTGKQPPKWATKPASWEDYCDSRGMDDITRGVEDGSKPRHRFWMPSATSTNPNREREVARRSGTDGLPVAPPETQIVQGQNSEQSSDMDLLIPSGDLLSFSGSEFQNREQIAKTCKLGIERRQRSHSVSERRPSASGDANDRRKRASTSVASVPHASRPTGKPVPRAGEGAVRAGIGYVESNRKRLTDVLGIDPEYDWLDDVTEPAPFRRTG